MSAPQEILRLVDQFHRNHDSYVSPSYNETQLRREFLDPFFEALGWDVNNSKGHAEAYKDVIHEDAIKIGGATKAPDYSFRVGGTRKFFLEAKKPSVNLKDDIAPAFQLRRYAWTAKLPLSVLSDFQELAIYDTRVKPDQNDKASTARINYITYDQYPDRWEEINGIFSREAVLQGSFDKYAASSKLKKGTAQVDDAFLEDIESWRLALAENIAIRNEKLSTRELNDAVQRTIDRIIFLRICEDRGIEEYGHLQALTNGPHIYKRLAQLFERADERYNSGLFHFKDEKNYSEHPDTLTLSLEIDDKTLKPILQQLYYPESPYEFSVLGADILGLVYEQFLGKIIRLTPAHRAKVEDKPEVKKAGGVFYTPTYIVDYNVKNTVGMLVEGKTPEEVAKLTVLDISCGSGSFLLGGYQYLLDWHLTYYTEHDPESYAKKKNPPVYQTTTGWKLTTAERKKILLNNIYGVDIDAQAVEVTKLSLLLKVLEGETEATITSQYKLVHERALPDLGSNIKCGNSLIGPDFYKQGTLLDAEERLRINVFDWNAEFPDIMRRGGFDAVIGNPPYLLLQEVEDNQKYYDFFEKNYISAQYKVDLYHLFIEKSIRLLRNGGYIGFITPNTYLLNKFNDKLRKFILDTTCVHVIVLNDSQVFKDASVDTAISIFRRTDDKGERDANEVDVINKLIEKNYKVKQSIFVANPVNEFKVFQDLESNGWIEKIKNNSIPLGDFANAYFGIQTFDRQKFVAVEAKTTSYRRIIDGGDVMRYQIIPRNEFVNFIPEAVKSGGKKEVYENPKIVVRQIGAAPIASYDDSGLYSLNTLYNIYLVKPAFDLKYVIGIINSKVIQRYWQINFFDHKQTFPKIKKEPLHSIPIRNLDLKKTDDKARHDRMVELVDEMLRLHKAAAAAKMPHEKTSLDRQITATDSQIDALVYELYGLTEEEIKVVEGK